MTGVGNKGAYKNKVQQIEKLIEEKGEEAKFAIAFFDINELKAVNTKYGYEVGDELISAAHILKEIFDRKNVYRVASDEFIAVLENKGLLDMDDCFNRFDREIAKYNKDKDSEPKLACAKGTAVFDPRRREHETQQSGLLQRQGKERRFDCVTDIHEVKCT